MSEEDPTAEEIVGKENVVDVVIATGPRSHAIASPGSLSLTSNPEGCAVLSVIAWGTKWK